MRGRNGFLFALLLICTAACGCSKAVEPSPVTHYPMTAGDWWEYAEVDTAVNFRPVQTGTSISLPSEHLNHHVEFSGAATLRDSLATQRFHRYVIGDSIRYSGDQYYQLKRDSLFVIAYSTGSLIMPKRPFGVKFTFGQRAYASMRELTQAFIDPRPNPSGPNGDILVFEDIPPKSMVFPFFIGSDWMFRSPWMEPFTIRKKIVGAETVSTPAGRFDCFKIQWYWDVNRDGAWEGNMSGFDYVCTKGIVKREFIFKNVTVTNDDPTPVGTVDLVTRFLLTASDAHQ